jgi:uncharacterized protein YggU (UPF0235/DUF167 family)
MEKSFKEKRIRKITHLYYSRQDVLNAIFDFSKNREVVPRYFDGFGKRPDSFFYKNDIFELVKKGATSFHCSEELWKDPLKIVTGMGEDEANNLRIGWDLVLDIDCKWFDYSKLAAKSIIKVLNEHGVKNIGLKFSGSKGWHIIIPWKAFPKELNGVDMKNLFPEIPKKIVEYIKFKAEKNLKEMLPENFFNEFKGAGIKKGVKCNKCSEISNEYNLVDFFCSLCKIGEQKKILFDSKKELRCPNCGNFFNIKNETAVYECPKCLISSDKNPDNFAGGIRLERDLFELMGLDVILVSSRHLFRMPYSLHEKTALCSVVISPDELDNFEIKNAEPMNVKVKNFISECQEGEANELLMQALDWYSSNPKKSISKAKGKFADFKVLNLKNVCEKDFPPCIQKILNGISDGRKRALFVLINFFRFIGMNKEDLEKKIDLWNKKNKLPLKQGYIKTQLSWSYKNKPIMPPNCREFYKGMGVCIPDSLCNIIKNPINYVVRKCGKK